ncbi:MAG: ABC transporter permease [Sulfurimicrobium sp.]|nr:ABC transporter permease [Sulfurimicrobium sp.]MDP1705033.1 ABC transporter permease [Sulfurimicrobium sp.]MDP2198466.1 ABC transporter permease [Sulfurimicrobium sp.]MDP2961654.1 ABC transporter permease [Sulfurimicrobium sp.]MDP3689319.1 ABC transporter permease [Sulfurimicrobium sp.]
MNTADVLRFASFSLAGARTRTLLMVAAMAIGVASVVVLTSLGEGARRYVAGQFSSLGTHLLIVFPGRSETTGNPGMLLGETPRDLTLDDALTLTRSRAIRRIAPLTVGAALVSTHKRSRETPVLGSTAEMLEIRKMSMGQGQFLPGGDPRQALPVCVLGDKVRRELFGNQPAVGEWLRIGDRRFRVIGVLAAQGQSMGFDTDELVIVPVASAQMLFNTSSLFRILIEARGRESIEHAKQDALDILAQRHDGEKDVTVVTQDAILATFDRILRALTLAVAGIAAISLSVAGILIMNVMLIAVSQRRQEIGLLKAIGAAPAQIRMLFFAEAAVLSFAGALAGLVLGFSGSFVIGRIYPVLPSVPPWWAVAAAFGTALVTGILFSVAPARRASRLDPIESLARH